MTSNTTRKVAYSGPRKNVRWLFCFTCINFAVLATQNQLRELFIASISASEIVKSSSLFG